MTTPNQDNSSKPDTVEKLLALRGLDTPNHLNERLQASIDLLMTSKSVELDALPRNSYITIESAGGPYVFLSPARDSLTPYEWTWITYTSEGEPDEVPVRMVGATAGHGTVAETSTVRFRKDGYFLFEEVYDFKSGADPHIPELYSSMVSADAIDTQTAEEYIIRGIMKRHATKGLVWRGVEDRIISGIHQVRTLADSGLGSDL